MSKIGFNLLVWSAAVSEDLFPILERLKNIGYDGAEFFISPAENAIYNKVGDFTRQLGLDTTGVFVLDRDHNPIDESAIVRERALDKIKSNIDLAQRLNISVICGPIHSAHTVFAARPASEDEYKRAAEVLYSAGDYAAQAGITLTPEALNRFECYLCNTMEQLLHLVKTTNHPNVKAMYDTHHANMEEKSFANAIRTIAPVLGHVHISENDRGTPGSGHINFDESFATLAEVGYNGWFTIEAFSRNDPGFANAIGVWREFSEPWDIAEGGYKFIRSMFEKHGIK